MTMSTDDFTQPRSFEAVSDDGNFAPIGQNWSAIESQYAMSPTQNLNRDCFSNTMRRYHD